MRVKQLNGSGQIPKSFRPLLWGLRWENLNVNEDKEDIIVNVINEGSLEQWRWIIQSYGKKIIRAVLEKRLVSEFHPESLRLAKIIFSLSPLRRSR